MDTKVVTLLNYAMVSQLPVTFTYSSKQRTVLVKSLSLVDSKNDVLFLAVELAKDGEFHQSGSSYGSGVVKNFRLSKCSNVRKS